MSRNQTFPLIAALLAVVGLGAGHDAVSAGVSDAAKPKLQRVVKNAEGDWVLVEQPRIVGGRNATAGEVPWQVALIITDQNDDTVQFLCGGSILKNGWILTAAHCATGYELAPGKILAISGKLKVNDPGATRETATQVIVHPLYCEGTHDYDIALIKAKTTGTPITPATAAPAANTKVVVSGFGTTSEGGSTSIALKLVEVKTKSAASCNDKTAYDGHISDKMLCAGPVDPARPADSCQGDSGGPLFSITAPQVEVGVVSWGEGCARPGKFGVYADVARLNSWIAANAK